MAARRATLSRGGARLGRGGRASGRRGPAVAGLRAGGRAGRWPWLTQEERGADGRVTHPGRRRLGRARAPSPGTGRIAASAAPPRVYKERVTELLLGPLLRHVGEHEATIWVETDAPCVVQVRAGTHIGEDRTFRIASHDYAIVVLAGLEPGSSTAYEILLDGRLAWPLPGSPFPASRIRTIDPGAPVRLLFGSCREPGREGRHAAIDPDVLSAYALRMASQAHEE